MLSIEYHVGAKCDFDESFRWYQKRSDRAALRFLAAIDDALEKILDDPDRFAATHAGCRYCALKRYPFRIVFRRENQRLLVFAIAHAKREEGYWWQRVS